MDKETEKIIQDQWKILPQTIRQLFIGAWQQQILAVGKKYDLNEAQLTKFTNETILMMLCITDPRVYTNNLKTQVQVTNEMANSISFEVESLILRGLKQELVTFFKSIEIDPIETANEEIKKVLKDLPELMQVKINESGWQTKVLTIINEYKFSPKETGSILLETLFVITGTSDLEEYRKEITSILKDKKEVVDSFVMRVGTGVFEKKESTTENLVAEKQQQNNSETIVVVTPSDMLSRFNQTMTTPSTLAPTKRSYDEKSPLDTSSPTPNTSQGIKSIDPYREIPEK